MERMKANTYSNKGEKLKQIDLPNHFQEEIRPDLIKRAVLVVQANKRQPYGAKERAGMDYSGTLSKRRRAYRGVYGRGMSRIPKKILWRRGTQFGYVGAIAPGTVAGRRAHPPKPQKDWSQKINKKERLKAIRSAIAATIDKEYLTKKGFKSLENLPLIIKDLEKLNKTKEIKQLLVKLKLEKEIQRASKKKIRPGKGTLRGRKYKKPTGPLIVLDKKIKINLPGFETVQVNSLNTELLAPGAEPGRLVIWSEGAIEKLKGLFIK